MYLQRRVSISCTDEISYNIIGFCGLFAALNGTIAGPVALTSDCTDQSDKEILAAKNIFLAFLLASKPFVQLLANIFVGPLTDRIGYDVPMLFGYIVIIASSLSKDIFLESANDGNKDF